MKECDGCEGEYDSLDWEMEWELWLCPHCFYTTRYEDNFNDGDDYNDGAE